MAHWRARSVLLGWCDGILTWCIFTQHYCLSTLTGGGGLLGHLAAVFIPPLRPRLDPSESPSFANSLVFRVADETFVAYERELLADWQLSGLLGPALDP